jgi:hypothetical protein
MEPTSYKQGNQSETGYQLTQFEVHPKGSHNKGHAVGGGALVGVIGCGQKCWESRYGPRRKERKKALERLKRKKVFCPK